MLGAELGFLPFKKCVVLCLGVQKEINHIWNWICDVIYDLIINHNLKGCNWNTNRNEAIVKKGVNIVAMIIIMWKVTWVKTMWYACEFKRDRVRGITTVRKGSVSRASTTSRFPIPFLNICNLENLFNSWIAYMLMLPKEESIRWNKWEMKTYLTNWFGYE